MKILGKLTVLMTLGRIVPPPCPECSINLCCVYRPRQAGLLENMLGVLLVVHTAVEVARHGLLASSDCSLFCENTFQLSSDNLFCPIFCADLKYARHMTRVAGR